MDVVKAMRDYITKMVESASDMKVLLLDEDTTSYVSVVYAQSEILQKEVYLIERVDQTQRETMAHLKAICFLRPTEESVNALKQELLKPKYGQYYIYFSHVLKPNLLAELAKADEHEVVREVQEFFGDYYALSRDLFSFNIVGCLGDSPTTWRRGVLDRVSKGLTSVLLSLKKKPVVRYQGSSEVCKTLADDIVYTMQQEPSLFAFRKTHDVPPVLLILDRRDDPVTPMLNQWTYQAMVHELLGIYKNRVDLSRVPGINKDLKEIVLSTEQDEFFAQNMYLNFGEIGGSIRELVDSFQKRTKSHENIESIADMKAFVENYPQFRAMSGTVSKHVSVVGELSRLVEVQDLLSVSEVEQETACQSNHSEMVQKIRDLLKSPKTSPLDSIRLVMLYAIRYERNSSNVLEEFVETLHRMNIDDNLRKMIPRVLRYAGAGSNERSSDLFGTKGAAGLLKKMTKGLKGVENIYTQHSPLLAQTLDSLSKGRLKDTTFPFVDRSYKDRPQDVIVFMVGGTTYAELKAVSEFNEANPSMRVILGGTTVHNLKSFMKELSASSGQRGRGTAAARGPRRPKHR